MTKITVTAPGALLILAISLAGGIVLLGLFFLSPNVESQKDAALMDQAARIEQGVRQTFTEGQENLQTACAAAAQMPEMKATLHDGDSNRFDALANRMFVQSPASEGWLLDADGALRASWHKGETAGQALPIDANEVAQAVRDARRSGSRVTGGLVRVAYTAMIVSFQDILGEHGPAGRLCLAWQIDARTLQWIGSAIGGNVVFVPGYDVPSGKTLSGMPGRAVWSFGEEKLATAWQAVDIAGQNVGYFRVDVPVSEIQNQASTARRIVLIILSLSVGLVLLMIMGVHILVAGPVVRLLKRLQQIDGTDGAVSDLTRDLHGEPLVLARKLESAFEKLAHISKTDQLTALANRRHFSEVLECFYHQSRRYNRPLSLIMLDIDFFKAVNDTAGHQAGDEILKAVSVAIEGACRKADLPARLGGDEFAVLLPETYCADALRVAERVRQTVAAEPITAGAIKMELTVSIGIADLNSGEIDSPDTMMSLADKALYAAKEMGRNRIVLAQDLTSVKGVTDGQEDRKVDVLCSKLAGLDNQFKDLFLQSVKEMVIVMETRDPNMADHAHKVQHFAVLIAQELGLPDRVIQRIAVSAMLHDVGMLAMPDSILLSQGQLTLEQLQQMRQHPLLSVRVMERMQFLEQEIPAVRYHHERFDGKGYPEGIAGSTIPLTARILAVADTFDALTSSRSYRPALSRAQAVEEIRKGAGSQFDPVVVEAFVAVATRLGDQLMQVRQRPLPSRWRDAEPSAPKADAGAQIVDRRK